MDYTVHGILQARILEWVAFPFSRASSQPRDQTKVSHIAGRFFTSWATREAQEYWVAYPFSSRSSQLRNQTGVSFIAGRFFTNWAMVWLVQSPNTCSTSFSQMPCTSRYKYFSKHEPQLSLPSDTYVLSHFRYVQLFATIWTVTYQAPLSKEFSRQEY